MAEKNSIQKKKAEVGIGFVVQWSPCSVVLHASHSPYGLEMEIDWKFGYLRCGLLPYVDVLSFSSDVGELVASLKVE